MDNNTAKKIKCPLCGMLFRKEDAAASACSKCIMKHGCKFTKCPNCGYEIIT